MFGQLAVVPETPEAMTVKLTIPICAVLTLAACGSRAPGEGEEIGGTESGTSGTDTIGDTSGDASGDESEDLGDLDIPDEDDPCLEPSPGQLCLANQGFLFSVIKPSSVLVEDLDGDERLDVVAIGISSSLVRVAPGQGGAAFGDWIDSEVSGGIRGAALGRIDDDDSPDLVLANLFGPAGTGVAYGDGSGGFGMPLFKPTGGAPRAVAIGSIDADDWPDVAVVDEDGQVFVLLGDGMGTLTSVGSMPVGLEPYDLILGDLDLDSITDIATVDRGANTISVLWGEGGGAFMPAQSEPVGAGPRGLAASDLDADGDLDLLSADFDAGTLSVLTNLAELEPRSFAPAITLAVGVSPYAVAAGDISGDGLPDIVSADSGAAQISVLASLEGRGGYAPAIAFEVGFEPFDVALADLDDDGRLDVVTANFGSGTLTLLTTRP